MLSRGSRPVERPTGRAYGGRSRWVSGAAFLGFAVLIGLIALADMHELMETVSHIEPLLLVLPLAAALASYGAMARSYQGIAAAAGIRFDFGEMLRITFVANSINYLVATGGLSGFAARLYFFTCRGISGGTATTISLAQGFITNASLLVFVLAGFAYLVSSARLSATALVTSGIALGLVALLTVLAAVLLVRRRLRRRLIFITARASDRLLHRFLPRYKPARTRIWRFQRNLNRSIDFLLARKSQMWMPTAWIVLDWIATIGILQAAFTCVRHGVPFGVLIIGFTIGIGLSFVSLIPGGLGLMEGSMAAVFTGFGVPFETAVVVVLIFRLAFHVMPLVVSLFFFRGLLVEGRAHSGPLARGTGDPPPPI